VETATSRPAGAVAQAQHGLAARHVEVGLVGHETRQARQLAREHRRLDRRALGHRGGDGRLAGAGIEAQRRDDRRLVGTPALARARRPRRRLTGGLGGRARGVVDRLGAQVLLDLAGAARLGELEAHLARERVARGLAHEEPPDESARDHAHRDAGDRGHATAWGATLVGRRVELGRGTEVVDARIGRRLGHAHRPPATIEWE
jgi:hypothetical protein